MKTTVIARANSTASDLLVTMLIGILATVLLLIVSATRVSAQARTFATNAAAPAANETVASPTRSDASPVPHGYARMTWPKATRAIARGEVLRAEDFVLTDTVIVWRWNTPSTDTMTAVVGWATRRPIAQGEFMRPPSIAPANAITLGSQVKVFWQDGPVKLTLTGTATNNAALGAPVGVRIDKDRRLDGIAVAPNTVRLR